MQRAGIVKKIAALLLALILMSAFYLYALLREDEGTKGSESWVVSAEDVPFTKQETVSSTDPSELAAAMGLPFPLPAVLTEGEVKDGSYHGYYVRNLTASDGQRTIRGIRPASAAPQLRQKSLNFFHTDKTLLGYPLLMAQKDEHSYYYFSTELAAFMIEIPDTLGEDDALKGFVPAAPQ